MLDAAILSSLQIQSKLTLRAGFWAKYDYPIIIISSQRRSEQVLESESKC